MAQDQFDDIIDEMARRMKAANVNANAVAQNTKTQLLNFAEAVGVQVHSRYSNGDRQFNFLLNDMAHQYHVNLNNVVVEQLVVALSYTGYQATVVPPFAGRHDEGLVWSIKITNR